ncbi:MAG TPA: aldehyde dehydrogenase family protein, partial [Advenella sp.]|nr:aldehyde dehydrogenase family protein [Advenella sp.]
MTQMLINGTKTDAVNTLTIDVIDPSDGKVFTTIPRGQQEDVDKAVKAARAALLGDWGQLAAFER